MSRGICTLCDRVTDDLTEYEHPANPEWELELCKFCADRHKRVARR